MPAKGSECVRCILLCFIQRNRAMMLTVCVPLYIRPHNAVCVLILLYMCPHTAICVSSYCMLHSEKSEQCCRLFAD